MRWIVAVLLAASTASAQSPFYSDEDQATLRQYWPADVKFPEGMKFYRQTRHSQRFANTNGVDGITMVHRDQDDVWQNAETVVNPNRIFPFRVSGGMDEAKGWQSRTAVYVPPGKTIVVWQQRSPVGRERQFLPKLHWSYPEGTIFADMLVYERQVFELRMRKKARGEWHSRVAYVSGVKPPGHTGLKKTCADCHSRAGDSTDYGTSWRGDDGVISAPILVEGVVRFDFDNWPLEQR